VRNSVKAYFERPCSSEGAQNDLPSSLTPPQGLPKTWAVRCRNFWCLSLFWKAAAQGLQCHYMLHCGNPTQTGDGLNLCGILSSKLTWNLGKEPKANPYGQAFLQFFISVWGSNPTANYCKCRQFLPFSILNLVPWNEVPPLHLSFYHQMTLCYIPYGKKCEPNCTKGLFYVVGAKKISGRFSFILLKS